MADTTLFEIIDGEIRCASFSVTGFSQTRVERDNRTRWHLKLFHSLDVGLSLAGYHPGVKDHSTELTIALKSSSINSLRTDRSSLPYTKLPLITGRKSIQS